MSFIATLGIHVVIMTIDPPERHFVPYLNHDLPIIIAEHQKNYALSDISVFEFKTRPVFLIGLLQGVEPIIAHDYARGVPYLEKVTTTPAAESEFRSEVFRKCLHPT